MAEMTLEKAEEILAGCRNHGSYQNMTDVQIAKKLEKIHRDTGLAMAYSSLVFLRLSIDRDIATLTALAFFFGIIVFAIYLLVRSARYSKIRDLFDAAGTQNLSQLDLKVIGPTASRDTPNDW
jgi:hypothetical protein